MSSQSPTQNVEMRIAEVGEDGNGLHRVQARDADRSALEAIDASGILDANARAQFLQRNRLLLGGDSGGEKEDPVGRGIQHSSAPCFELEGSGPPSTRDVPLPAHLIQVSQLPKEHIGHAAFFLLFFNEAERRSEGSGKCRRVNGGDGSEKKGLGVPGNRIGDIPG
ncbi:hypothetical protein GG344DRAFT_70833 [Lentinula edodes]|nr:hypothetical protein GG344DRAFT_70833 [Lentinula edodes]